MLQWSLPGTRAEFFWECLSGTMWINFGGILGLCCYLTKFEKRRSFTVTARNQMKSAFINCVFWIRCAIRFLRTEVCMLLTCIWCLFQRHLYIQALFCTICEISGLVEAFLHRESNIRPFGETANVSFPAVFVAQAPGPGVPRCEL